MTNASVPGPQWCTLPGRRDSSAMGSRHDHLVGMLCGCGPRAVQSARQAARERLSSRPKKRDRCVQIRTQIPGSGANVSEPQETQIALALGRVLVQSHKFYEIDFKLEHCGTFDCAKSSLLR